MSRRWSQRVTDTGADDGLAEHKGGPTKWLTRAWRPAGENPMRATESFEWLGIRGIEGVKENIRQIKLQADLAPASAEEAMAKALMDSGLSFLHIEYVSHSYAEVIFNLNNLKYDDNYK